MVNQDFAFGPFRMMGRFGPLYRDGEELKLPPKAAAVLWILTREPGAIVTKQALTQAIWPDTVVSDGSLSFQVQTLRDLLGDDARHPRYIATVHRVGFRFIAPLHQADVPAPRPSPSFFVGRERELATLADAYAQACAGRRQLVFVSGEAGIGKTTLVDVFVQTGGIRAAHGQCVAHFGAGEPHLPLFEALGRLCRQPAGPAVVAALRRVAPSWLAQLPAAVTPEEHRALQARAAGATRERMLREIAEALDEIAGLAETATPAPLVWVIEDLHWSDLSTLDVLMMFARRREPASVMIVATLRAQDLALDHPARVLEQTLVAERYATRLALGALDRADVERYLAPRCAPADLAALTARVFEKSEGHPLFMREISNYIEFLPRFAGAPQGLPDALHVLISSQLERLTARELELLEAASVAGSEFVAAPVAHALGWPVAEVEARCDALLGGFIEARGLATWAEETCGRYRFRHALYQQVLYERAPAARRARLHLAIAEDTERAHGDSAHEVAGELAAHYARANALEAAERHHRVAAQHALLRGAPQEAAHHLRQVLEFVSRRPEPSARAEEARLHTMLGEALISTRGYTSKEVEQAFGRARQSCLEHRHDVAIAPALWGLCMFHLIRAEFGPARELADELMHLGPASPMRFAAELAIAAIDLFTGAPRAALARCEPLLQHIAGGAEADSLHGQDVRVEALAIATWAAFLSGDDARAFEEARRALDLGRATRRPNSLAVALYRDGVLRSLRGDYVLALARAEALVALAREHGLPHWEALGLLLLGGERALAGDRAGLPLLRDAIATRAAMGCGLGATHDALTLARACVRLGERRHAEDAIAQARAQMAKTGERLWQPYIDAVAAELSALPSSAPA